MGFACPLSFLFVTHYRADVGNGLIEDEVVHVFGGRFDDMPKPDPSEVSEWRWVTPDEMARDIAARPELYTARFRVYCRDFWREMAG